MEGVRKVVESDFLVCRFPTSLPSLVRFHHRLETTQTGEICLDLLKTAWSPAWTLQSACLAVAVLLTQPEPNSPLNIDAGALRNRTDGVGTDGVLTFASANLLRCGDLVAYESLVRYYTEVYAKN